MQLSTFDGAPRARRFVAWVLFLCALGFAGGCSEPEPRDEGEGATRSAAAKPRRSDGPRYNVVLVSVDTLRADHLSLYGYDRPTSPNLEALAAESVVFDQFIMNGGFTLPSHMTMMTSLLPTVHGIKGHDDPALPEARITLAEQLKEAGYATAGFVDGGYVRGIYGFTQGFDTYDDRGGYLRKILPKATSWLRDQTEKQPFFLFLHTYDVHANRIKRPNAGDRSYNCPAPFPNRYVDEPPAGFTGCRDGLCANQLLRAVNKDFMAGGTPPSEFFSAEEMAYIVALYDGCINYVDEKIGELVALLKELGLYDRTLLVVTSDHGEEFLDHGMLLHQQRGYEEVAHIPLLFKLPASRLGGRRVPHLAAMIDLMPTILDVVGVPLNHEAQGRSLLPAMVDGRPLRDHTTIWEVLRTEQWKYFPEERLLFDLQNDPEELHNRRRELPGVATDLHKLVRENRARDRRYAAALKNATAAPGEDVQLTEEQLQELKALGYID